MGQPFEIVTSSSSSFSPEEGILDNLSSVTAGELRGLVEEFAFPRHFEQEPEMNRKIGSLIFKKFEALGFTVGRQGEFGNIVASSCPDQEIRVLIGAHFDSVPGSPGADDNASALAALLTAARVIGPERPVMFVAFNREEDSLLGSRDFVSNYPVGALSSLGAVHILEMLGYRDDSPGSQFVPPDMPLDLPDRGDFLAIVANQDSAELVDGLLAAGQGVSPALSILGLKVFGGLEHRFPHLKRSDHTPFWALGLPALMWTDTSEFRNPHYHQATDTPDTLDYDFLAEITRVLIADTIRLLSD